jgi:hypothetical protein
MAWGDRWVVDEPPVTLLRHDTSSVPARCAAPAVNRRTPRTSTAGATPGPPPAERRR